MLLRPAQSKDIHNLAKMWYDGWHDAHAALVPAEYARERTLERFRDNLVSRLDHVYVIVDDNDKPIGLSITKDDELNQFYVSAESRGKGVAQVLIADVEKRLAEQGHDTIWLACAIGNYRAARFYEKSGWHLATNFVVELPTPGAVFSIEVWRYEKQVGRCIGAA